MIAKFDCYKLIFLFEMLIINASQSYSVVTGKAILHLNVSLYNIVLFSFSTHSSVPVSISSHNK